MGVFQTLHRYGSAAALAERLRDATRAQHGTAARAFPARLARDRSEHPDEVRDTLTALREAFLAGHAPDTTTGQVRSVAARFALIGAAGELARDYGILPWPKGERVIARLRGPGGRRKPARRATSSAVTAPTRLCATPSAHAFPEGLIGRSFTSLTSSAAE
jgi:hypothetical protein